MTADVNMNSHKLTGLSIPSSAGDSLRATATITEANLEAVIQGQPAGVEYDSDITTGEVTRLGSLAGYAKSVSPGNSVLPDIYGNIKRCIINDAGERQYYLDGYNEDGVAPSVTGTDDAGTADKVSDVGVFTDAESEYVGKYVHNTTDDTYAMITAKDSDDVLSIDEDIMDLGEEFEICTAVLNGDDGQVVDEYPKIWYRYEYRNSKLRKYISDIERVGFSVHPAFTPNDVEKDHIYVGAFQANLWDADVSAFIDGDGTDQYGAGDKLGSVAGLRPVTSITKTNARTAAALRGAGWQLWDIAVIDLLQTLYLIEYADMDSQTVLGKGNTSFSSFVYATCIPKNGLSLGDGNDSGGAESVSGSLSDYVSYRGIEHFYGNVWQWLDGIIVNNNGSVSQAYICNNPANYTDAATTNYDLVTEGTLQETDDYIKEFIPCELGFLPAEGGGASDEYACDQYYTYFDDSPSSGLRAFRVGGNAAHGSRAGVFCGSSNVAASHVGARHGVRVCFRG